MLNETGLKNKNLRAQIAEVKKIAEAHIRLALIRSRVARHDEIWGA